MDTKPVDPKKILHTQYKSCFGKVLVNIYWTNKSLKIVAKDIIERTNALVPMFNTCEGSEIDVIYQDVDRQVFETTCLSLCKSIALIFQDAIIQTCNKEK